MKIWLGWILGAILCGNFAAAQNVVLKDGKVITAKGLRRQGDTIMANVEIAPAADGKPAQLGEIGYALSQITRIEFPEPPVLHTASALLAQKQAKEALAQLDPVVDFYEGFREAPGSWWSRLLVLKAQVLVHLGREEEAETLCHRVVQFSPEMEVQQAAEVQIARDLVRRHDLPKALGLAQKALQESKMPETLALASVVKGDCLLASKSWDDALLSYLEVPVFYPGEKDLLPQVLFGQGVALFGMEKFADAKAALEELAKTCPDSPEAQKVPEEQELILRREKALAPPK